MSKNFQENGLQNHQVIFTNLLFPYTFKYSIQYYIQEHALKMDQSEGMCSPLSHPAQILKLKSNYQKPRYSKHICEERFQDQSWIVEFVSYWGAFSKSYKNQSYYIHNQKYIIHAAHLFIQV